MTVAAWVSAGAAVVSAVLAGVSWWSANKSRAAKRAAESSSEQANRSVAAAEQSASAAREQLAILERVAQRAEGPELWLEGAGGSTLTLRTRLPEVVVTGLDGPPDTSFMLGETPATVTPNRPMTVRFDDSLLVAPDETAAGLLIEGRSTTTWVPLPSGM